MKEIKVQVSHAKIDTPLECTMSLRDDEFFIENEFFAPIMIENTQFVPVEARTFAIIRSFLAIHRKEWRKMLETYNGLDYTPPIYEKIRQNNAREWQQERLSKQQNNK